MCLFSEKEGVRKGTSRLRERVDKATQGRSGVDRTQGRG